MIGKHRVQIGDNTIRYDFVLSRNITIIRGDSETGKSKRLYREHKISELGKVFYACTGRTYEGDRTGISQEKIKQTVSLCQSDENIIKVFTGQ